MIRDGLKNQRFFVWHFIPCFRSWSNAFNGDVIYVWFDN